MIDALDQLLSLPGSERAARGLTHTPAEIAQQPATWSGTWRLVHGRAREVRSFLDRCDPGSAARVVPSLLLVGAGTSDFVGRSLRALFWREWNCAADAVPSTDLLTNAADWVQADSPGMWISFSRSGDSPEAVALLELALSRYPRVCHLIVCCNQDGRVVRDFAADPRVLALVLDPAVNDRGLAMTSSYSNMVIAGQALAHIFSLEQYEKRFEELSAVAAPFRRRAADLSARLASDRYDKVCFLGAGALKAVARESALKVLELTAGRVHTMSESSLGLRHGPLSAIDQNTLVVSFLSSDLRRRRFEVDLLSEVRDKKLARALVAIAAAPDPAVSSVADHVLEVGEAASVEDDYRPPVDVMFGQLLGLFASIEQGVQPDSPSPSGAISRVVSGVRIHS